MGRKLHLILITVGFFTVIFYLFHNRGYAMTQMHKKYQDVDGSKIQNFQQDPGKLYPSDAKPNNILGSRNEGDGGKVSILHLGKEVMLPNKNNVDVDNNKASNQNGKINENLKDNLNAEGSSRNENVNVNDVKDAQIIRQRTTPSLSKDQVAQEREKLQQAKMPQNKMQTNEGIKERAPEKTGSEDSRQGEGRGQGQGSRQGEARGQGQINSADNQDLARHIMTGQKNQSSASQEVFSQECPSDYAIEGSDDSWFRTQITQKSPMEKQTTDIKPSIVILTPVSNSEQNLKRYFSNLCSLSYPHELISVVLGEDSSNDRTIELAKKHIQILKPHFKRMEFIQLRSFGPSGSGQNRHASQYQLTRRKHLAMSRNQLIFAGVHDEQYVLWIDSDVKHIPRDIIERLLAVKKQIVVPNCLYKMSTGRTDTFDRNTWRETEGSKNYLNSKQEQFLMLEGYEPTKRKFLNDLKEEGEVVKLDGVGGCVLLIEADLHRAGLVFPAFVFDHHIETEGLSKMAARLNIELYGLPSVNVIHS